MLPRVEAGTVPSAAWLNELRDMVVSCSKVQAGAGISLSQSPLGLLISATQIASDWRQAVIAGAPDGPDQVGQSIRYDVQIPGLPLETGLAVTLWRPIGGPDVRYIPARVGDPCFVLIRPDGEGGHETFLCCPTESLSPGTCDNAGGTAP